MSSEKAVKGIIDLYIDGENVRRILKSSVVTSNTVLSEVVESYKNETTDKNLAKFNKILTNNKELKESWDELINEPNILYAVINTNYYIVYKEKDTDSLKLAIIWKSTENLEEILYKATKILKEFFTEVMPRKYHYKKVIYNLDKMITNESNIDFYPFFKNSFKRDYIEVTNLKVDVRSESFIKRDKVASLTLTILANVFVYLFVKEAALTSFIASVTTFLIYLIVGYFFRRKNNIKISVDSLNFNDSPEDVESIVEDPQKNLLNNISLK